MFPSVETYRLARREREFPPIHDDCGYGFFSGGDPRKFTPDEECSTEEERAKHKAACEAWDRDERPDIGPPCEHLSSGGVSLIITKSGYGLGVNTYEWPCTGRGCDACGYGPPPRSTMPADVAAAVAAVRRARTARKKERKQLAARLRRLRQKGLV